MCDTGLEGGWGGRLGFGKRYLWCVCAPIFVYHQSSSLYHFHLNKKDITDGSSPFRLGVPLLSFGPLVYTLPNFSSDSSLSFSVSISSKILAPHPGFSLANYVHLSRRPFHLSVSRTYSLMFLVISDPLHLCTLLLHLCPSPSSFNLPPPPSLPVWLPPCQSLSSPSHPPFLSAPPFSTSQPRLLSQDTLLGSYPVALVTAPHSGHLHSPPPLQSPPPTTSIHLPPIFPESQ